MPIPAEVVSVVVSPLPQVMPHDREVHSWRFPRRDEKRVAEDLALRRRLNVLRALLDALRVAPMRPAQARRERLLLREIEALLRLGNELAWQSARTRDELERFEVRAEVAVGAVFRLLNQRDADSL